MHILPRRPATSLVDLDDEQCRSLALVLRDVVRRYDALWGFALPYVLAVHQAPVGDHPHYPFHLELHPPLRAPGLLQIPGGPRGGRRVDDERVGSRREGGGAPCHPRLTAPGACSASSATTCATSWSQCRGIDMAAVAGETVADTIYAIDRVADDALLGWFEEHWPDVRIVSEGLDEPVVVGDRRRMDGDRRHHRRDAWAHVRQAPRLVPRRRGAAGRHRWPTSSAAAMTELPTAKQGAATS